MRWAMIIFGALMVLLGGIWLLQGVGILPGSFMTGDSFWAVVGLVVLVVGAVLAFFGFRQRAAGPRV